MTLEDLLANMALSLTYRHHHFYIGRFSNNKLVVDE